MYFATKPAEPLYSLGDALLVGGNDLSEVLGVHARRKRRRPDEVRKHHRDLAALGALGSFWLRWRGRRCRRRSVGDSFQQPFAVAERSDAEFLQVGVVELGENCKVDVVLGKALGVLSEAQLL